MSKLSRSDKYYQDVTLVIVGSIIFVIGLTGCAAFTAGIYFTGGASIAPAILCGVAAVGGASLVSVFAPRAYAHRPDEPEVHVSEEIRKTYHDLFDKIHHKTNKIFHKHKTENHPSFFKRVKKDKIKVESLDENEIHAYTSNRSRC